MLLILNLADGDPRPRVGTVENLAEVEASGFVVVIARFVSSSSLWPIMSSIVRKPSRAISSRTSWAMNLKKLITCSAWPRNLCTQRWVLSGNADRAGIEVADAHHHAAHHHQWGGREAVFLCTQSAAITTSRPVFNWPSVWTMIRSRSLFITRVC